MQAALLMVLKARKVLAKKRQCKKQQYGMFGSGKGVQKEREVKKSDKRRGRWDGTRVGEDGKSVYWGSVRMV